MKIRTGFVSNSSSSSFCIYGTSSGMFSTKKIMNHLNTLPCDELDEFCKCLPGYSELAKNHTFTENNVEELLNEYDVIDVLPELHKAGLEEYHYFDTKFIGRSWKTIKDDETGKQFKENIKLHLIKYINENDARFETYEEAWYNG